MRKLADLLSEQGSSLSCLELRMKRRASDRGAGETSSRAKALGGGISGNNAKRAGPFILGEPLPAGWAGVRGAGVRAQAQSDGQPCRAECHTHHSALCGAPASGL